MSDNERSRGDLNHQSPQATSKVYGGGEGHSHVFRPAPLKYDDGTPIEGGRRCSCGMEVVGDGTFALNAGLARTFRTFNQEIADAMARAAERVNEATRRMFP